MNTATTPQSVDFEGLRIEYDEQVLTPRPWTAAQSHWAAELIRMAPPGPVLEVCSGAGHIGLLAVTLAPRSLVCVDADPAACSYLRRNAAAAGLRVDVREGPDGRGPRPGRGVRGDNRRPTVGARRDETARFPEDPVSAIDGGADGLDLVRSCLEVIDRHLAVAGSAVLQTGPDQAERVVADARLASTSLR